MTKMLFKKTYENAKLFIDYFRQKLLTERDYVFLCEREDFPTRKYTDDFHIALHDGDHAIAIMVDEESIKDIITSLDDVIHFFPNCFNE